MASATASADQVRCIVRSYHEGWTSGNMTVARSFLADRIDFQGSIDSFTSADELVAALSAFHGALKGVHTLHEFYAVESAMLLYDCLTVTPAGTIRTAEYFRVSQGKIREIKLVFDASDLRPKASQ